MWSDPRILQAAVDTSTQVMDAVKYMREGRAWVEKLGLDRMVAARLLGQFEVRFVVTLHRKKATQRRNFDDIPSIAQQFVDDVRKARGYAHRCWCVLRVWLMCLRVYGCVCLCVHVCVLVCLWGRCVCM